MLSLSSKMPLGESRTTANFSDSGRFDDTTCDAFECVAHIALADVERVDEATLYRTLCCRGPMQANASW